MGIGGCGRWCCCICGCGMKVGAGIKEGPDIEAMLVDTVATPECCANNTLVTTALLANTTATIRSTDISAHTQAK